MKRALIIVAMLLVGGVAYATSPPPTTTPETDKQPAEQIEAEAPAKLKKCTGCHGKQLEGKKKVVKIAGMAVKKILDAVGHGIVADKIEEGVEPAGKIPKKMKAVSKKLTDAEKKAIAIYISKCAKDGCK